MGGTMVEPLVRRSKVPSPQGRVWRILPASTWLAALSHACALGSVVCYFAAAERFSGAAGEAGGYQHWVHYWCDLLTPTLDSGAANPARPLAIAANLCLSLSLIPLWLQIDRLFRPQSPKTLVRVAGVGAMVSAAFVPTVWHDSAVATTACLGAVAWTATMFSVDRRRFLRVWGVGLGAGLLAIGNYLLWTSHAWPQITPAVQKSALATTLLWIVSGNLEIRRVETALPSRETSAGV